MTTKSVQILNNGFKHILNANLSLVFKYDVNWVQVWERLDSPVLDPLAREYLFLIINNIVPNRERLFMKMNLVNSPNCVICHVREDNTHIFTEYIMVREAWGWTVNSSAQFSSTFQSNKD